MHVEKAPPSSPDAKGGGGRLAPALGLALALGVAAGFRLWRLEQNGDGNAYYTAAVRSMMGSASNFVFGAFDPGGFITVDKPPVALWFQVVSARVFGCSGWSVLLPQALMGVASVGLLFAMVRKVAGPWAATVAGLAMAVAFASVAVDRDNLPDSALVLFLMLGAWATLRACAPGRAR